MSGRQLVDALRPFPLLIVALVLLAAATGLLVGTDRAGELATVLAALGAVCLGAWITVAAITHTKG